MSESVGVCACDWRGRLPHVRLPVHRHVHTIHSSLRDSTCWHQQAHAFGETHPRTHIQTHTHKQRNCHQSVTSATLCPLPGPASASAHHGAGQSAKSKALSMSLRHTHTHMLQPMAQTTEPAQCGNSLSRLGCDTTEEADSLQQGGPCCLLEPHS